MLKKSGGDKKQASFAQVSSLKNLDLIPKEAMLAQQSRELDAELIAQPEAAGYEFQSQGIIDMLAKLLDKFSDELTTLEKEEVASNHAFDMLISDLTAQVADSTTSRDEKAETKAGKLEAKADAEGTVQDSTATRDDDQKYLDDLTATCAQKAQDFADRQALRGEELVAIG